MISIVTRHLALLQKLCIALMLAWSVLMLVLFWLSGVHETKLAQATGKRFIIYTADGRVVGKTVAIIKAGKDGKPEELVVPKAEDGAQEEVKDLPPMEPSKTPIASVKDDMLETVAGVTIPRISEAKVAPWHYYVKPFRRPNESPMVAIIVTGLGQSRKADELALRLDERIGLSFSPYSHTLTSWTGASRLTGHEMYVDLPVQTANYPASDDPGPYAILVAHSNTDNLKNFYWAMSRFQGYVGMVAGEGDVVTNKYDAFKPLADEMAKRGVLLITARDNGTHDEKDPVKMSKVPVMSSDVWIDEELTQMSIQARLATLEQTAQRNGFAIGIAQAYPLSINEIKHWQENLGERGVQLAPVSFIAKLKNNQ